MTIVVPRSRIARTSSSVRSVSVGFSPASTSSSSSTSGRVASAGPRSSWSSTTCARCAACARGSPCWSKDARSSKAIRTPCSPISASSTPTWVPRMLEVDGLGVAYGDVQVLWDLSLRVEQGEIVTLLGANGAGKTTLLRAISRTVPARTGSIVLAGERIDRAPSARVVELGVAHVPEGRRLWPDMSVEDNLVLGAYRRRAADGRDRARSDEQTLDPDAGRTLARAGPDHRRRDVRSGAPHQRRGDHRAARRAERAPSTRARDPRLRDRDRPRRQQRNPRRAARQRRSAKGVLRAVTARAGAAFRPCPSRCAGARRSGRGAWEP